jgi:signal peptidase I
MHPTLPEGAYYMVNKYIYYFVSPKRGDIVVFRRDGPASQEYVKRVIGLPGETLAIQGGDVYVNGRRLDEPYAFGRSHPDVGLHTIEKDVYFVLGDNRPMSEDSREFGAVPLTDIMGKIKPDEFFPTSRLASPGTRARHRPSHVAKPPHLAQHLQILPSCLEENPDGRDG